MTVDQDDMDFMQSMEQMFGMDKDAVEHLLDKLDADALTALTDAVAKQDKPAAHEVIQSFEDDEQLNSLIRGKDIAAQKDKKTKRPVRPPKDHQYAIGDDVALKMPNDDGKTKFVSATVYKPKAPGNTVGVKIEGKPKMVDRNQIYILKETIMGMINVPELQRMQQLAGIPAESSSMQQAPPVVQHTVDDEAAQRAMAALDMLEEVLPEVRLADLKTIRQRLIALQANINESVTASGRQRKDQL